MPNSITSVRQVGTDAKSFVVSINRCDTLAELVDLVPAPFRPRMQELVNRVYRAALKSNHARSYLSTLEKHRSDGTFPPEIAGRIHPPTIQISKEYTASADCKSAMAQIDTSSRHHKVAMLEAAINLKAAEVSYLQSVFAETSYSEEVKLIYSDVANQLGTDAGLTPDAEGSFSIQSMPSWIQDDCQIFVNTRAMYPQRAIAIAYAAVQKEMSKKFKSLSLKKRTDEDVEMQDSSSKSETVQSLINQSLEQFKKELKLQKPGMTASLSNTEENCLTDTPRQRKGPKGQKSQTQQQSSTADSEGHQVRVRKRKRERREETSRQASKLERALSGAVAKTERSDSFGSTSTLVVAGCGPSGPPSVVPLTELRLKDRTVVSTDFACQFLEDYSDLFCGVSAEARQHFVSRHTPVPIFEVGHRFAEGIFKGPDVVIPRYIEYKLALNCKFILHHSPNSLRVHQAWPLLERSVRLRWHFRHSDREQSKFYVPKKDWMPPKKQWNPAIEKGLMKGRDLLFEKTAALNPSSVHRSNPDLRSISDFLQSSQLLLKITDKNLGLAAISKPWYEEQCLLLLSDTKTYESIPFQHLLDYQHDALERIKEIVHGNTFSRDVSEFLLESVDDSSIPEFHAIPKVHKTPWTLRPIVPSHSWVTRRASEVCDFTLRAFHKKEFPWVVDSTREVISRLLEQTVVRSDSTWLVTGDVESFYTNVETQTTIEQLAVVLTDEFSTNGIVHEAIPALLEVVMSVNCFGFNGNHFLQTRGVAMGTSCAPAFANVALGFKEQFVESIAKAADGSKDGLIFYVRYIDDIFLVFKGTKSACQSCLDEISLGLKPFKIGWEINSCREPISFLDVEFFFEQGFGPVGIQSRVFRKRMNQHQYIPWSSAHPKTVKKAFIKAELTRYMVISSTRRLFEEKASEFMKALGRRGYPSTILHIWKKQVNYEDRSYTLSKRKDASVRGQPLMLPSSYDEVWEYTDLRDVFKTMMDEWIKCGEPLPLSLFGPLIKSLKRTENMFDKFSSWNKAVLRSYFVVPGLVLLPPAPQGALERGR